MRLQHILAFLPALCLIITSPAEAQPKNKHATLSAALNQSALQPGQSAVVAVVVDIEKGYHAQSHTPNTPELIPLTNTIDKAEQFTAGQIIYPPGKNETYPNLGQVPLNVYSDRAIIYLPITVAPTAAPGDITLTGEVRLQICDARQCFQPQKIKWSLATKIIPATEKITPANPELFKDYKPAIEAPSRAAPPAPSVPTPGTTPPRASGPPPVDTVQGYKPSSLIMALLTALFAGVLFNIVPCVLPVLPIKVLGFVEVAHHNRTKTLMLAGVFSLGIVTVFAVLALLVIVLRTIGWGQQFANPYFAWGMVGVLLLLSLWLFGLLNITLPTGAYSFAPNHETYFGNYLWGILTAVLSTPCTGPLFGPLIGWAVNEPVTVGVAVMLLAGAGMALPYIILSGFPELARKFPRVGPWAELFKQMLGFAMLGFTVNFAVARLSGIVIGWWAVVPVGVMAAFYLIARTIQLTRNAAPVAISTGLAMILFCTPVLVALRFSGLLQAQGETASAPGEQSGTRRGTEVRWTPYSQDAVAAARKSDKLVLIKFTASWCYNCQLIEANVYHDAQALDALARHGVVMIKADLTSDDAPGWPLLKQFHPAGGIPLTVIYSPAYDQPVQIPDIYKTSTLLQTLQQLEPTKTAQATGL